jgi:hypothetical protein
MLLRRFCVVKGGLKFYDLGNCRNSRGIRMFDLGNSMNSGGIRMFDLGNSRNSVGLKPNAELRKDAKAPSSFIGAVLVI